MRKIFNFSATWLVLIGLVLTTDLALATQMKAAPAPLAGAGALGLIVVGIAAVIRRSQKRRLARQRMDRNR